MGIDEAYVISGMQFHTQHNTWGTQPWDFTKKPSLLGGLFSGLLSSLPLIFHAELQCHPVSDHLATSPPLSAPLSFVGGMICFADTGSGWVRTIPSGASLLAHTALRVSTRRRLWQRGSFSQVPEAAQEFCSSP